MMGKGSLMELGQAPKRKTGSQRSAPLSKEAGRSKGEGKIALKLVERQCNQDKETGKGAC